jgi:hypothetical protein
MPGVSPFLPEILRTQILATGKRQLFENPGHLDKSEFLPQRNQLGTGRFRVLSAADATPKGAEFRVALQLKRANTGKPASIR